MSGERRIRLEYDPDEDEGSWVLLEPYVRETLIGPVMVPDGFRTDLASVPWQVVWRKMYDKFGKWTGAAVIHDFLYQTQPDGVTREQADLVFRDLMRRDGVPYGIVDIMYKAVRQHGWRAWRSHSSQA
jgi:hypothetical protein